MKFLSYLYHANESKSSRPILELHHFYSDSLCRKLNFKEEYKVWKSLIQGPQNGSLGSNPPRSHSRGMPSTRSFSFLNFPFLFDPVAKTRVLHIDAMTQMSLQFEDAFVHQALVIHAQRFMTDTDASSSFEQDMESKTNPYLVLQIRRERMIDDVRKNCSLIPHRF